MPSCRLLLAIATALALPAAASAQNSLPLRQDRLAPGFVAERWNEDGYAIGFESDNPWGEYTAYLMATDADGRRSWRIEQYLPNPGTDFRQGSTMYLVEGDARALLIDTAQPSQNPADHGLKALVRTLLGHENDGSVRDAPVDFIVANTHGHADHIGENRQFSDRTLYYMAGDWPDAAPANYVPVKEGGGPTPNGQALGSIDLGGRVLRVIDMPPHTPGSVGYLDSAHDMFFTGDAVGSGYVWLHWASISRYAATMDRIAELTEGRSDLAVLPAHFYQIRADHRRFGPLGHEYLLDQRATAHGVLDGTIDGEPYYVVGPGAVWAGTGSARMTYAFEWLDPEPGADYRAIAIPGHMVSPAQADARYAPLFAMHTPLFLIRSRQGETLYLLIGSRAALLIGTGLGAPGLADMVERLKGDVPLEVALLSDDPAQAGGLAQLSPAAVHRPGDGDTIELGAAPDGTAITLTAVAADSASVALLSPGDRTLFLGEGEAPAGAKGLYDLIYSARSSAWMVTPH
ncbi:MBL fold metallo-hydrolase [Sphingosinithalassobacter portus]|uniref:MBL fold metallo-hydrolase n=1 Tax=Stakelama portus TaxID=2676234 RepID=UPI0013795B3F|nr:MBL fold metallo-hydrolase [Sphingosinithalassobacter portus]